MKTIKFSIIILLIQVYCVGYSQFNMKRIHKINDEMFLEYEVKKFKNSAQLIFPNKSEKISRIVSLSDTTFIIKTRFNKKEPGKPKTKITKFYEYDLVSNNLIEINNQVSIDSLNQLISDQHIEMEKGSFDKEEAKEVVKDLAVGLTAMILTGKNYENHESNFIVKHPNSTISVKCIAKWLTVDDVIKSLSLSFFNDSLNYSSTFSLNNTFYPSMQSFQISPNGRYIMVKRLLFDLKDKKVYSFFELPTSYLQYISFNRNCTKLIVLTETFRTNLILDVISFKKDFTTKLTKYENKYIEEESKYLDEKSNDSTIQIGSQIWMAQNLNIGDMIRNKDRQEHNNRIEKYCYNNTEENCKIYGGLYQWKEMMAYNENDPQGICPEGWHIPSIEEWKTLIEYLGGSKEAGGRLKEKGDKHWTMKEKVKNKFAGISPSGFNALPGGYRSKATNRFAAIGLLGYYRNSTKGSAYALYAHEKLIKKGPPDATSGFSVRCVKN